MENNTHTVLVYGTLRPFTNEDVVLIPGRLYDLGWYPGIELSSDPELEPDEGHGYVVCERITVTDERLEQLDNYEGVNSGGHGYGLYSRERIGDDFIYVYRNYGDEEPFKNATLIESGDWLKYSQEQAKQDWGHDNDPWMPEETEGWIH